MTPNDAEVAKICRKHFNKDDLSGAWGEKEGVTVWLKQGADLSRYESERKIMVGDITIESIRTPGPKTVILKLKGLGTDVTDSMILAYVKRMGTIKREVVGWEIYRGDSTGFLEGLATGAREVIVTLKEGLEIPVFHRMKGRRVRIEVDGHRDCYNCYQSSKRCPVRGRTRECQKMNSNPQTSWQSRLKGFLEEISTTEQELWKEQRVTGEEEVEVVELEEEANYQIGEQDTAGVEKSDTEVMNLDEDIKLAGIEFRCLKGQAAGKAGIMEWQGVIIGIVNLSKSEEVELCKEVKMSVEKDGCLVMKAEGKSELMKKIWTGMKEVLKEEGSYMVPIEEAPPTPVKEANKTKLTVIQEARKRAREKVKKHEEALNEKERRKKKVAASKARSSMTVLELETKEEELEKELGKVIESVKEANDDLEYAEANLKSLERQAEEAQVAGVIAMEEYEKNKNNGNKQIKLDAENHAKFLRDSASMAEKARNEKEFATSVVLVEKDKLEEELKEVKKQRKEKEEEERVKKDAARKTGTVEIIIEEERASISRRVHAEDTPEVEGLLSQHSPGLLNDAAAEVLVDAGRDHGVEDNTQKACPPAQTQWGAYTGDGSSTESVLAQLTSSSQDQGCNREGARTPTAESHPPKLAEIGGVENTHRACPQAQTQWGQHHVMTVPVKVCWPS